VCVGCVCVWGGGVRWGGGGRARRAHVVFADGEAAAHACLSGPSLSKTTNWLCPFTFSFRTRLCPSWLQALIQAGASLEARSDDGSTPLHYAIGRSIMTGELWRVQVGPDPATWPHSAQPLPAWNHAARRLWAT
jgi:hypothetical protein